MADEPRPCRPQPGSLSPQEWQKLWRDVRLATLDVAIDPPYRQELENELKMLRVARKLERRLSVTMRTSFLDAHVLPPEIRRPGG
jgi:imidazolonepropionase-like amidohydrolase